MVVEAVEATFDERMRQANTALAHFDGALARQILEPLSVDRPDDPAVAAGLVEAKLILRERDVFGAAEDLVRQAPDSALAHIVNGLVLLGIRDDPTLLGAISGGYGGDLDAARAAFAQALAIDGASIRAIRGLATVERLSGRREHALGRLDTALGVHGDHPDLLVEKAWCYLDAWDLRRVEAVLTEATRVDQYCFEAVNLLADLYRGYELDDPAKAAWYAESLPPSPVRDEILGWLASDSISRTENLSLRQRASEEARRCFQTVLEASPTHPGARLGLISLMRTDDTPDTMLQRYAAEAAEDPSPQLRAAYAWEAYYLGKFDLARSLFDRLSAEAPYVVEIWVGLVMTTLAQDDFDQAESALDRARRSLGRSPRLFTAEAKYLIRRGRLEDAWKLCDATEAVISAPFAARWLRHEILVSWNCLSEACERLWSYIAVYPGDAYTHQVLGDIAAQQQRWAHASDSYERALLLEPDSVPAKQGLQASRKRLRRRPLLKRYNSATDGVRLDDEVVARARPADEVRRRIARYVPPPAHLPVSGRLQYLRAPLARSEAYESVVVDQFWIPISIALFTFAAVSTPAVLDAAVFAGPTHSVWWYVAVGICSGAAYIGLLWIFDSRPLFPAFMIIGSLFAATVLAPRWGLTVRGFGEVVALLVLASTGAFLVTATIWVVYERALRRLRSRMRAGQPDAALLEDLLWLCELTNRPVTGWDDQWRRQYLDQLERIAANAAQCTGYTGYPGKAKQTDHSVLARQRRATEVKAGIRELKWLVISPGPASDDELRRRVRAMLRAVSFRYWGELPLGTPEELRSRVRATASRVWVPVTLVTVIALLGVGASWLELTSEAVQLITAGVGAVGVLSASAGASLRGGRDSKETETTPGRVDSQASRRN